MNNQPLKRDWFYWFIALFTATQLPSSALIVLDFMLHPLAPDYMYQSTVFRLFYMLVIVPVVVFVALLVIRRVPYNVTGLFLLLWVTIIIGSTARDDVNVRMLSGTLFGWVGIWFLPLYFPDGHAYPRRFDRYIRWLCVGLVLSLVAWTLSPLLPARSYSIAVTTEGILLTAIQLILLPSMIARYLGSDQRTRQQLKWLGWVFLGILLVTIPMVVSGFITRDIRTMTSPERLIRFLGGLLITLAPFLAVGNAVLRYRLYDIDIIIRRTLIYSTITALLAGVYFGGVALMQNLFVSITGQQSPLAVVASTLVIAALFAPLRRRVQDFVDRRFYRQKYDAQKTLEAFAVTMRDEVDMESLKAQLVSVVHDTMQPTTISLWVREPGQKREVR
jgi:hypothetical protein